MAKQLNNHHRNTVDKIFAHPLSGNIEWRQVLSLLENIATVDDEHNGKVRVELGSETEYLEAPRDKDIDEQMVVDLRRMLRQAGYSTSE